MRLAIADCYRLDGKLLAQAILLNTAAALATLPRLNTLLF
jgi:hypothetical protein